MWIPKVEALIRGRRLFKARRLLEEIQYVRNTFVIKTSLSFQVISILLYKKLKRKVFQNRLFHTPSIFIECKTKKELSTKYGFF